MSHCISHLVTSTDATAPFARRAYLRGALEGHLAGEVLKHLSHCAGPIEEEIDAGKPAAQPGPDAAAAGKEAQRFAQDLRLLEVHSCAPFVAPLQRHVHQLVQASVVVLCHANVGHASAPVEERHAKTAQVEQLLASDAPTPICVGGDQEAGDPELVAAQQARLLALAPRTLARPLGRGALTFGALLLAASRTGVHLQ